jgi:hypothetical protein
MATLSLLSDLAREQPLVCAVDGAQWLDPASAQTLAFVARHLAAAPAAVIFAVRQPADARGLAGLPEFQLDERVRNRIGLGNDQVPHKSPLSHLIMTSPGFGDHGTRARRVPSKICMIINQGPVSAARWRSGGWRNC